MTTSRIGETAGRRSEASRANKAAGTRGHSSVPVASREDCCVARTELEALHWRRYELASQLATQPPVKAASRRRSSRCVRERRRRRGRQGASPRLRAPACHGANGISSTKDVPNLAGQRPGYLYLELRAYQSGARGDSTMGAAVKTLNDNALVKVAAYYASLDPAQPSFDERRKGGACPGRSGSGRQGCRGRLCWLSRRCRHQQDARHAKPGRAGSEVSCRGHESLQERATQERCDEVNGLRSR